MPINNFGKSSRRRSQGLPKFFRASMYRAHRTVFFAIARLSCYEFSLSTLFVPVFPLQHFEDNFGGTKMASLKAMFM